MLWALERKEVTYSATTGMAFIGVVGARIMEIGLECGKLYI